MAQRWPAPKTKPKLTQEEFDDAVRTNIEDFDMSPEEAVKSAVDEFNLQGYDMTCVVRTAAGGELASHPVSLATQAISEAGAELTALEAAFGQLSQQLDAAQASDAAPDKNGSSAQQELSAVAIRSNTLAVVLDVLRKLLQAGSESSALQAPLVLARRLMALSLDIRDSFDDLGGPELMLQLCDSHPSDLGFQACLATTCQCACWREEQNKEQLMERGYGVRLLTLLREHTSNAAADAASVGVPDDLIVGACGVLQSLTTADDDRPPSSKAFMTARVLARQHQALSVLLTLLRARMGAGGQLEASQVEALAAILAAVRQLAANEEICKDFSDAGGVVAILKCLESMEGRSRDGVRCALGALRQLTHSDGTKRLLSEQDGAELLLRCAGRHAGEEDVVEPVLGVLANMTLRQPEIVERCASAGVVEWVLGVMAESPASSLVQRQACILMRNMVVRNLELRPVFLGKGAEDAVRAAKRAHPKSCTDVGSAALRDLGLDNYNA